MGLHCLMLLWSCPTGSGRGEREAKGKPPSPGCSPWLLAPSRELGTRLEGTATDLHWFEDRGWGRGAKQAVHEGRVWAMPPETSALSRLASGLFF